MGYDFTESVRAAILALPEQVWAASLTQDSEPRENGQVAEVTEALDLTSWPEGARVIVRRERPHPGAQLSFSDHDGHRFQAILTDQPDPDIAALERRHRARARVEDHIRGDKDSGLRNLPFRDFEHNRVWLQLVLIAHDLITWTQALLLSGELARAEPKRLRYRLLHVAARLAFHARGARLRLQATWPLGERPRARVRAAQSAPRARRLTRRPPATTIPPTDAQAPGGACPHPATDPGPHRLQHPRKPPSTLIDCPPSPSHTRNAQQHHFHELVARSGLGSLRR